MGWKMLSTSHSQMRSVSCLATSSCTRAAGMQRLRGLMTVGDELGNSFNFALNKGSLRDVQQPWTNYGLPVSLSYSPHFFLSGANPGRHPLSCTVLVWSRQASLHFCDGQTTEFVGELVRSP